MPRSRKDPEVPPIDEALVDRDLEMIERVMRFPWHRDLKHVEALTERLRVELIVRELRGSQKQLYRAIIDRFEDVLEERYEKEDEDRDKLRRSVLAYVRSLWSGLDV